MTQNLERLLRKVDRSVDSGLFILPPEIKDRRVLRYFLEHAKNQDSHPIVIAEESYTRQSVIHKIGDDRCYNSNRNVVMTLLDYRLLRMQSGYKKHGNRSLIGNLSLAQVFSYAYNVPIEDIFVPSNYFNSLSFKSMDLGSRIRTLVNAYTGVSWFERFKRKYNRRRKFQKFTPWHNISTADLPKILCTSDYEPGDPAGNLTKLVSAGFIFPKKRFKRFSSRNFVDVNALIELASSITGIPKRELTNYDPYIEMIAKSYIKNRLLPHMGRTGLGIREKVTLRRARIRTGQDSDILCRALKIRPQKKKRFYSNYTKVSAIDSAIYELKNTHEQIFTSEDVEILFGMKDIDLERCNLYTTRSRTYARHHRVFPFYDTVTEVAKRLLLKREEQKPIKINGDTYYLTEKAVESYIRVYNLQEFNPECYDHIANCLRRGEKRKDQVINRDLICFLDGNNITRVKINWRGYTPHDSIR